MEKRVQFVIDEQGRPVVSATVRVTQYPGGALATIYSDDGVTPMANPVATDADGRYEYYVANGHYTEVITTNLGAQPAINDILFDDSLTTNQQFAVATGTGDAMVVAAFGAGYTLVDGDEIRVRAPSANTLTNPTINLPGVGVLTITKYGGDALSAGDIKGAGHELHLRYRASPARVELLDPQADENAITALADADATLTVGSSTPTQRLNVALTANRTLTLSTTGAQNGDRFLVIRGPSATGDFDLNVGAVAVLAANEWCEVGYDGAAWVLLRRSPLGFEAVSADNGNNPATLTVGTSAKTQVWNTPISADRAVTLNTGAARNADEFHVVRTAAATGAFNLNVGTGPLKALAVGQWCVVKYNGSAWYLDKFGSL